MKKTLIMTIACFTLTSCAHYAWVSDKKPASQLDSDLINCEHWAYQQLPPLAAKETKTEMVPIQHYDKKYKHQSTTYVPQQNLVATDMNEPPRKIAVKKCMMEKTWTWQRID